MSKERELLRKALHVFTSSKVWGGQEYTYLPIHPCQYKGISAEIEELLSQPEQEPEAWILKEKETGYKTQVAYRPSVLKKGWEAIALYPEKEHGIGE